VTNLPFSYLI